MQTSQRKVGLRVLIACLLFQGVSALAGGYGLLSDPSGEGIGLDDSLLKGSPFQDFLIPGLTLFFVLGVFPLVVTYGAWKRQRWAWMGSLAVGVLLVGWITVQILIVGYTPRPPLQFIYGALGIAILALTFAPSVRRQLLG